MSDRKFQSSENSSSEPEYSLNDFRNKHHPTRDQHIGWDILSKRQGKSFSRNIENNEPVAVADNNEENLKIEIYENKIKGITDILDYLRRDMDDLVLYLEFDETPETELKNTEATHYYTFNQEDFTEVKKYLDQFSEEEANRYIRSQDIPSTFTPTDRFR